MDLWRSLKYIKFVTFKSKIHYITTTIFVVIHCLLQIRNKKTSHIFLLIPTLTLIQCACGAAQSVQHPLQQQHGHFSVDDIWGLTEDDIFS